MMSRSETPTWRTRGLVLVVVLLACAAMSAWPTLAQETNPLIPCNPETDAHCGGGGGGGGGDPIYDPVETFIKSLDQEPFQYPDVGSFGVVLSSGEYIKQVTDMRIPGRGFDFEFVRSYRSRNKIETVLGRGWNFNYNERFVYYTAGGFFEWIRGDSWSDVFEWDGYGYVSSFGFYGRAKFVEAGAEVELRTPDGMIRHFAAGDGHLMFIEDRNGNRMSFYYDSEDRIDYIIDTMGRRIELTYGASSGYLVSIEGGGRRVDYLVSYGKLVEVEAIGIILKEGDPSVNLTTTYEYRPEIEGELQDNLTAIYDAKGHKYLSLEYGTVEADYDYDRVTLQRYGDQSPGVQEISYEYQELPGPDEWQMTRIVRRSGATSEHYYDAGGALVRQLAINGAHTDPNAHRAETSYVYGDQSGRLFRVTYPMGNETWYVYEDGSGPYYADPSDPDPETALYQDDGYPDTYRGGNLAKIIQIAGIRGDGHGGSSADRVIRFTFDPIYNSERTRTDVDGNVWTTRFDYEEIDCVGADHDDLLAYTSFWQIDITEGNDPTCGAGDLNDDSDTSAIKGNGVRTMEPVFTDAGGNPQPAPVTKLQYNEYGQPTKVIDPGGFVTHFDYYPEDRPFDGTTVTTPSPPDRTLDTVTGGYLRSMVIDAVDAPLGRPAEPTGAPAPVALQMDYTYDVRGNQIEVIDPRGVVSTALVNLLNLPLRQEPASAIDSSRGEAGLSPVSLAVSLAYDSNLNVIETRETASETTGVFLGGSFAEIVTTYEYDLLNNLTKKTVQWGLGADDRHVSHIVYDLAERPIRLISPEGRVAYTEYDPWGRVTQVTRFANQLAVPVTDTSQNPTADTVHDQVSQFSYNVHSGLTQTLTKDIKESGGSEVWDDTYRWYNGFDEVIQVRGAGCAVTRPDYDDRGLTTTVATWGTIGGQTPTAPTECTSTQPQLATTYRLFDEHGRLKESQREDMQHSPADPLTRFPNPNDGSLQIARTFYDARGLVGQVTDDKDRVTSFVYDGVGRVIETRLPQVDDPDNPGTLIDTQVSAVEYNNGGLPVHTIRTETGPGGASVAYDSTATYDALGRVLTTTVGTGAEASTVTHEYDVRGNVKKTTYPTGAETEYYYDAYDQLVKQEVLLKDETGQLVVNFANTDGKITTLLSYDGDGLLLTRTDDRGETVSYLYDGLGQAVQVEYPDDIAWVSEYSPRGHVLGVEIMDPNDVLAITYSLKYDAVGRLIERDATVAAPIAAKVVGPSQQAFEYDGLGRLTKATDTNSGLHGTSTVERVYDTLSRVLEERQTYLGLTSKVGSDYLNDGFRRKLTRYDTAQNVAWEQWYDADGLGRVEHVGFDDPSSTGEEFSLRYWYAGASRPMKRHTGFGETFTLERSVDYDPLGRMTALDYGAWSGMILQDEFGFERGLDNGGRPLFERYTHRPAGSTTVGRAFENDPAGRLSKILEGPLEDDPGTGEPAVLTPDDEWEYTLDGMGNWAEYRKDLLVQRTDADEMNFYDQVGREEIPGQPGTWDDGKALAKDILGNVHREPMDGYTLVYHHDAFGRLVEIEKEWPDLSRTDVADFAHDALNRRIETTVAGGDRRVWVYSGWRILEELGFSSASLASNPSTAPDVVIARNFYGLGLDEVVATDRDVDGSRDGTLESRLIPVMDLRGSTERILDLTGATLEWYEYTPYGDRTIWRSGSIQPTSAYDYNAAFTGHRVEMFLPGVKELLYARHREYDPAMGRFIERDPIGFAGGSNQYRYASAQPISLTDPLGLYSSSPNTKITVTGPKPEKSRCVKDPYSCFTFNDKMTPPASRAPFNPNGRHPGLSVANWSKQRDQRAEAEFDAQQEQERTWWLRYYVFFFLLEKDKQDGGSRASELAALLSTRDPLQLDVRTSEFYSFDLDYRWEPSGTPPSPPAASESATEGYLSRVGQNWVETNRVIPGWIAPTGTALCLRGAKTISDATGLFTYKDYLQSLRTPIMGVSRGAVLVSAIVNGVVTALTVGTGFEVGVLAGSAISEMPIHGGNGATIGEFWGETLLSGLNHGREVFGYERLPEP